MDHADPALQCRVCKKVPHTGIVDTSPAGPLSQSSINTIPNAWDELPGEIWSIVFELIMPENSAGTEEVDTDEAWIFKYGQKSLVAISMVSRRFSQLVEPFLYRNFRWIPAIKNSKIPPLDILNGRDIRPLHSRRRRRSNYIKEFGYHTLPPLLLLRTLLGRPGLAFYMKNMKILAPLPVYGTFWDITEAHENGLSSSEFQYCESVICRLPVSQRNWFDGLYQGRLDITVGLLLLIVGWWGRLNTLDIRIREGSTVGSAIFEVLTLSKKARSTGSLADIVGFQYLTNITLSKDFFEQMPTIDLYDHYDDEQFNVDQQASTLLAIPELEFLEIAYCSPIPNWPSPLPTASNLTHLGLTHGIMNDRSLKEVLAATPKLTELACRLVYDREFHFELNCEELNKEVIGQVSSTLESLVLKIDILYPDMDEDGSGDWDVSAPMGSMKHYQKLRYLDMPLITLVSKDQALKDKKWDDLGQPHEIEDEPRPNELEEILPRGLQTLKLDRQPKFPRSKLDTGADVMVRVFLRHRAHWLTNRNYDDVLYN